MRLKDTKIDYFTNGNGIAIREGENKIEIPTANVQELIQGIMVILKKTNGSKQLQD